jgi:flagellar motility protein MotE (MotC chaperone)
MPTPSEKAMDALLSARDGYHKSIEKFLKLQLEERDKEIKRLKESIKTLEAMVHDIRESVDNDRKD